MDTPKRKLKGIAGALIAIVILAGLIVWSRYSARAGISAHSTVPDTLPGINTTEPPGGPELIHLAERLKKIGLPALTEEGTVLHIHQHLDIYIAGTHVPVASGIGVHAAAGFISPIHTHDDTGIIHVESPTVETFTLGQFFDVWGERFTADCISMFCSSGDRTLKVFVNGNLYVGDPRAIILSPHEEIVVTFGRANELPATIPSSYTFPDGD